MRAYVLRHHGNADKVLNIEEIKEPEVGPEEVKVKIRAIGINFAEIISRRGEYGWAPKLPYTLGMEAVGIIENTGKHVKNRQIGDRVIVGAKYGTYAEKIIVPEHMTFPAIESFTDEENAAFVVNFMTAWVALFKLGKIEAGENILINAAGGGVGTAAVQLAKKQGCTVFGTAGKKEKINLLNNLGIDYPINYREEDFKSAILNKTKGVDFVLEMVGGEVYRKSMNMLNPFGRLVIAGIAGVKRPKYNPVAWYRFIKNLPRVKLMKMARNSNGIFATHIGYLIQDMDLKDKLWNELTGFVSHHNIKPVVGATYQFEELPSAHQLIENRKSYGKVVIKID